MRSGYWLLTIACVGPDIVNFIFHLYTFNCCSKEREQKLSPYCNHQALLHCLDCPLEGAAGLSRFEEEKTSSFFCNKCFFFSLPVCVCVLDLQ